MPLAARTENKTDHLDMLFDEFLKNGIAGSVLGFLTLSVSPPISIASNLTTGLIFLISAFSDSTGYVIGEGINVMIGKNFAVRAGIDTIYCDKCKRIRLIAQGDSTVFINGFPAARQLDICECGAIITEGNDNNVYFNGSKIDMTDMPSIVPKQLVIILAVADVAANYANAAQSAGELLKDPSFIKKANLAANALGLGNSIAGESDVIEKINNLDKMK